MVDDINETGRGFVNIIVGKIRAIAFQIWAMTLARNAFFHPARLILTRKDPLEGSLRMRLRAMWRRMARL